MHKYLLPLLFLIVACFACTQSASASGGISLPAVPTAGCTVINQSQGGANGSCDTYADAVNFLSVNQADPNNTCVLFSGVQGWFSIGQRYIPNPDQPTTLVWQLNCRNSANQGGWEPERTATVVGPDYFLKANGSHNGNPCNCPTGTDGHADPIELGTGNVSLHESDFVSADPRLQYSRWYNSGNATLPSALGTSWSGSFDSQIVPVVVYPSAPPDSTTSSNYPDPQSACLSGFADLVRKSNSPEIFDGMSVKYVPPQTSGPGICEEINQLGVQVGVIPILSDDFSILLPASPSPYQIGVELHRDDGSDYFFVCAKGTCQAGPNVSLSLTVDSSGYYTLTDESGVTEYYDNGGQLVSRTWKDGYQLSIVTGAHNNGPSRWVTDSHGRQLYLAYDSQLKLTSATAPNGSTIAFARDTQGRLATVTNPTGTRTYQYTSTTYPSGLTGVVDENTANGSPYVNWTYDGAGRAVDNVFAGGFAEYKFAYNDGTTTETDPFKVQRTYTFQNPFGTPQITSISGPVCFDCITGASSTYDSNGYLSGSTDWNGNHTAFQFDTAGELHQRIDAQGTAVQRATTIDWDDVLRNPLDANVKDAGGNTVSQVAWAYNASGEPLARCDKDPTVAGAMSYVCTDTGAAPTGVRRWTYAYCSATDGGQCPLAGLLKSVTDPLGHVTTYLYFASDDASCAGSPTTCPHRMGDLQSITNALGQTTTFLTYDGAGRPLSLTNVNGVETDLAYNARGWLTQTAVRATNGATGPGDEGTGYGYDNVGQLKTLTRGDGSSLAFTYDAAHRLTDIADNLGDTIHYTLDVAGNRTREDTRDPSGTLKHSVVRTFNNLGELYQTINADGTTVNGTYAYDANGNAQTFTDGRGTITNNLFDQLDRLNHVEQDPGTAPHVEANTALALDALDRITQVTDPHGLNTIYQYDGLGNLKQLTSPDTGSAVATFDAAGNLKTRTDARGIKATYTYDVLNRVKTISYPTTALKVTYVYDTTQGACNATTQSFGVGRLTSITDGSGNTRLCYDRFGNVARKVNIVNGVSFVTNYVYDLANRLKQVTTPAGTVIVYTRDAIGRVTKVTYKLSTGTTTTLVKAATYYPFGPVASITYNDNRVLNRSYDQDYVVSAISDTGTGGLNLSFGRDAIGNLTGLASGSSANTLAYDGLNRLTGVTDPNNGNAQIAAWTYDATGNRLTQQASASSPLSYYTYPSGSHQLIATGPVGNSVTRGYDAMGDTTSIGATQAFHYNDTGRMDQLQDGAGNVLMQYATNALGQRVEKYLTGNSAATQYAIRDESGNLIAEYDGSSSRIREMVWMDGMPVGVISGAGGTLSYLEPDQIGTPRIAIDGTTNSQTWSWSPVSDPFGQTQPAGSLNLDLRMPGQAYDAESGLSYNYFRDYDSSTDRELESDPLGLFAGVSTYAYAWGNPLRFADPFGLSPADAIAITKSVEQSIDQMVKDGHRLPGTGAFNGWLNNSKRFWTNWGPHAKYHQWDCYDQTSYVNDNLKQLKLDDHWHILTVTQPGHATGLALSDNPSDPMISYDSWRGTIVIIPSNNP